MKPSHELFRLIKSLSKSEKRFFKMMSSLQSGDKNYIKLFDAIEKQDVYDEDSIKEQFKNETFIKHLPSEKNHLYKLILKSLRLFHSENSVSVILAEHIQSIEILYNKALYPECGKLVKRAKKIAESHERFYYLFELIKWEKTLLEEEFQSGRFNHDLYKLVEEEHSVIKKLRNLAEYQILYNKINYVFRQGGYVRNDQERKIVDEILNHELIKGKNTALSKRAAATCYYIKGLCAIAQNEVESSFENFSLVVKIFEENPNLIQDIPKQYIKSLSNLLHYYVGTGDYGELFDLIAKMRALGEKAGFNRIDIKIRIFISTNYFEILAFERQGKFGLALKKVEEVHPKLEEFGDKLTKEDIVLFDHLFANVYFGAGKYRDALRTLNNILHDSENSLRQDIFVFSKMFMLLIHYELENFDLLNYLLKSTERYFTKQKKQNQVSYDFELALIRSFKRLIKAGVHTHKATEILKEMKKNLNRVLQNSDERVALEYFDYLTWIDAKIQGRSYGELKKLTSPPKVNQPA
ncbi:MAG: hypothetical protein Kow0075_10680 [Salibacteraceae bacterium]